MIFKIVCMYVSMIMCKVVWWYMFQGAFQVLVIMYSKYNYIVEDVQFEIIYGWHIEIEMEWVWLLEWD